MQRWWVVVGLACPVVAWWWLFLVLAPRLDEQGSGPEEERAEGRDLSS